MAADVLAFTRRQLAWYVARLADPGLIRQARVIPDTGDVLVPVGGSRKGGYVRVPGSVESAALVADLRDVPGFPGIRFEAGRVAWGEKEPDDRGCVSDAGWLKRDILCGRLYGFSEAAILRFVEEQLDKMIAENASWRGRHAARPG